MTKPSPESSIDPSDYQAKQLDSQGRLRHLLTLDGLPAALINRILDRAEDYLAAPDQMVVRNNALRGFTVANLFFEPSTRTRASFELAAKRLDADVLNLDVSTSSRIKGESILDTIYTLQAMQADVFVVRDAAVGVPGMIAASVRDGVSILNAGEASASHPTQGLLDVLTMRRACGDIGDLKVCIVGDIAHSRVARSTASALQTLGVDSLRLVAPAPMRPDPADFAGAEYYDNLADGVRDADIVMALRIQHERIVDKTGFPDTASYVDAYQLNHDNLKGASANCFVMHPGPMNRGVEIDGALADSPRSLITEQVRNGVAIRMALLEIVVATSKGISLS
ncbi:MAG: aspartate carbamoyltransferase catalytic subunit [Woeseiaceae bacterium]